MKSINQKPSIAESLKNAQRKSDKQKQETQIPAVQNQLQISLPANIILNKDWESVRDYLNQILETQNSQTTKIQTLIEETCQSVQANKSVTTSLNDKLGLLADLQSNIGDIKVELKLETIRLTSNLDDTNEKIDGLISTFKKLQRKTHDERILGFVFGLMCAGIIWFIVSRFI